MLLLVSYSTRYIFTAIALHCNKIVIINRLLLIRIVAVALYHTSTYILTYGQYFTMLTDPRPFYGYAYVYGSVSCTSTITRMYPWSGNGPMKSTLRHSIGVYVEVVNITISIKRFQRC